MNDSTDLDFDLDLAGCPEWEANLEALLFDELADDERAAVEEHLERCQDCRAALREARTALEALAEAKVEPASYPYPFAFAGPVLDEDRTGRRAWNEFRARLEPRRSQARSPFALPGSAAAAVALVGLGIAIGVSVTRRTAPPREVASMPETSALEPRAVDALERAELLADTGVRYVDGLRSVLGDVSRLTIETASSASLRETREHALSLIRDGRLLADSLDPERDRLFLSSISRAEVFLEEVAALETSTGKKNVLLLQASLAQSRLSNDLERLDVDDELARAIAASGVLAIDSGLSRKGP